MADDCGSDSDSGSDVCLSAFASMFGDVNECHGEAGGVYEYSSPADAPGEALRLKLSLARTTGDNTRLFAHYVWNSALLLSDCIMREQVPVAGLRIAELGAGCGIPGMASAFKGAELVVTSDYPDEQVLAALRGNVESAPDRISSRMRVVPHLWGSEPKELLAELPADAEERRFPTLLLADTLWMPDQHANLMRSVVALLSRKPGSVAWVAFTLQHDLTFDFFKLAPAHGLTPRRERMVKLPVMMGDVEVEEVDEVTDEKRTIFLYSLRWSDEDTVPPPLDPLPEEGDDRLELDHEAAAGGGSGGAE